MTPRSFSKITELPRPDVDALRLGLARAGFTGIGPAKKTYGYEFINATNANGIQMHFRVYAERKGNIYIEAFVGDDDLKSIGYGNTVEGVIDSVGNATQEWLDGLNESEEQEQLGIQAVQAALAKGMEFGYWTWEGGDNIYVGWGVGPKGWMQKLAEIQEYNPKATELAQLGAFMISFSFDEDSTCAYMVGREFDEEPLIDEDPEYTITTAPDGAVERLQQIVAGQTDDPWSDIRD